MSYLYKETIKAKLPEIPQIPHFCFLLPVLDHRKSNTLEKVVWVFSDLVGDLGFLRGGEG